MLHIIHGFGPGGVETWLLEAVKYLDAHPDLKLKFDFLLTSGVPGIFDQEIKKHGCQLFYARYSYSSILQFRKKFRDVLMNNNYTAVHDHQDFISGWHYMLAGKYLPAVRIAHLHNPYNFVHNYVVNPLRWFSFRVGRKLMAKYATKITGTSDSVMDEYGYDRAAFKFKRTSPAYCGFDTGKFTFDKDAKSQICRELNWTNDVKIALFVGRIGLQHYDTAANQKNPLFAFNIAIQLVTKYRHWNFIFAGYKGQTGSEMEEQAFRKGLGDRIKFLDVRRDVPKLMSACDVFVFPSLWEGLGMVAVEAQCAGLNVIMSDGVPKEAIVSESLVTVKSLKEAPDSWADSIAAAKEIVGRRRYADEIKNSPFSIENSVDRLIRLYES